MKTLPLMRKLLLVIALGILPGITFAQVAVSITIAPPELPVYEQPICPAPNYIWTPGYWAWGYDGYYWVPGTWVEAPSVGLLWTPGYWGWNDGSYIWNAGYWGPQVGFYGGIDYGYGYYGEGFYGGRWEGDQFSYNTAVMHVNPAVIHHTYVDRAVIHNSGMRVSFNGGHGGIQARPTEAQMSAEHARRFGPVAAQTRQVSFAREDRANYAKVNHGAPPHAALQRPATSEATFQKAVSARGAEPESHAAVRPEERPGARTESHTAARSETRTEPHSTPRPETHTAPRTESHPVARPESHTAARPETRTEPHSTPRPETHATAPRPESHPAARPESHPAPRPETHSAPRPEPHPAARPQEHAAPHAAARPEERPAPHEEKPKEM